MTICEAVGGTAVEILKGADCIGNDEPLVALSILPDKLRPHDTYAVVFSVSHCIADGWTYYKLLSMLSEDGNILPMNATRKHSITLHGKIAMGEDEAGWLYGCGTMCNVVCSMLYGSKALVESYILDADKINVEKAKAKEDDVDFVSTNDILTSSFGVATDADVLLMPINFREKLSGFTEHDAGNYEGALIFTPADYGKPSLIRKTLSTGPPAFLRGGNVASKADLPSCCATMGCRISMVTNWTFSCFSEVKLEGSK